MEGFAFLLKKCFNPIPVIFDSKYDELEIIGFDLFTGMYNVRYFAVYRRPTFDSVAVSYMTDLLDCLSVYGSVNRTVVIVGDFNLPKIDWDSYTGPSDTIHQMFVSFVVHSGLTQLINFKTHETNILDLLICNDVNYISRLQSDVPFGTSDHATITFNMFFFQKTTAVVSVSSKVVKLFINGTMPTSQELNVFYPAFTGLLFSVFTLQFMKCGMLLCQSYYWLLIRMFLGLRVDT